MTHIVAISPISFSTFGDLLRYLRRRARLQQRDLAIAVGYSEGQICRLEQNQRLPDLTTLAARFIPALDLEDVPALAARLLELATSARAEHPASPAPSDTRAAPPLGNLPAPLTPLINRTREIAALLASLAAPDVRLLTLVGPPGIGKTRLSLHVAAERRALFSGGVYFVALAPIRDPALVLPTIAHTLGITAHGERALIEALRATLCARPMLLVLDNFEHVAAAAPKVAEVLQAAPCLKILVTSRAALHLSGEHMFVVPPLDLPDPNHLPPLDQLARIPAIQLFTTRLHAMQPDFALTNENARAVAEICARLDGLPLAIELAAARGRLFSPQALLDRLGGASGPTTLQFLVGGPRDLLVHQQTLRGTLDWSYNLLDADERALLMRLAVFAGGCTDAAAAAVAAELKIENEKLRNPSSCEQSAISDTLLALVDKSLVECESDQEEAPRFSMLETIREYAREKLDTSGCGEHARYRHAAYYLELAQAAERELSGAQQERWFARLEAEQNNMRAALEWNFAHDLAGGLRLATSLRQFWYGRGSLTEGRSWLERLLAHAEIAGMPAAVRAQASCVAGFLAYQQGDLSTTVALSETSLALFRALGERRGIADASYNLAGAAFLRNEYSYATTLFDECLALYRELQQPAEVAQVLKNLGLIAKDQGDYARATAFFEESLALRRELGDKRGVAQSLFNLSIVAYWQGDSAHAAKLAGQSVAVYQTLGDKMGAAYAIETLGMAEHKQGDHQRAARLLEESLGIFRDLGDQVGVALLLTDLGLVARALGDSVRAARLHGESLALAWKMGDKRRVAFCLEGLAATAGTGQPLLAARLFGAAQALRAAIGSPLPPTERIGYEHDVAAVQAGDREGFVVAWAEGRVMPIGQVVAYALDSVKREA